VSIFKLKDYFEASDYAEDDSPIWRIWVTDGEEAAYINPMSGRVHGYVWHDGYGKYHPTVIVSPWRALRLLRQREGWVVSLLPFPRIAIECCRLKSDTIQLSQEYVEELLGSGKPV
jgi:hypothetical protein